MSAPRRIGGTWIAPDHVAAIYDDGSPYEPTTRILLTGGHAVTVPGTVDETVAALFGESPATPAKAAAAAALEAAAEYRARRRAEQLGEADQ